MKALRLGLVIIVTLFNGAVQATPLKAKDLSQEQIQAIQKYHQNLNQRSSSLKVKPAVAPARPYSEVEPAGYLFFSAENAYDSRHVKHSLAQNLPAGVTLVIFASPGQSQSDIQSEYQGLVDPTRLKIISLRNSSKGFWARDGLPVPVWNANGGMDLIDAKYYHGFEPDAELGQKFATNVEKHSYYFEGGNFMVNDLGDCLTVDNELSTQIPDSLFRDTYGCQRTIRFPFEKGIGHMDESIRFLTSRKVVTDSVSYARILERNGFEVVMLPRPRHEYETYVNALLVNNTMFVPTFGGASDQKALDIYRAAGFNVVGLNTTDLSNDGLGSIHCITMTYPAVPFNELLEKLGAKEL